MAGIWQHDGGPADASALAPMLASMVHRGPDDSGTWAEGRVAFGFQRLTILDLTAASHQPMLTPDGEGVLAYNGEVYNYRDLRRDLEREGVTFRSTGDSEVVLHALHRWGPERAIPLFNGMFAIAYLDRRSGTLWLARDRLGIKPLATCDTGRELLFASEVKALLAHPRVRKQVDRAAVQAWLLGGHRDGNDSLFAGIGGLAAGTWWKVTDRGIDRQRYHHAFTHLDIERLVAAAGMTEAAAADRLREAMQASVRLHLASDVPLAAMCSGGVDSSLVAAYARRDVPGMHAYVADIDFPDSEAAQAERVGRHLGLSVRCVRVDRERYLRLWPHTAWHLDRPSQHISDPALLAVTRTCRADGIKVLLTGEGADELFGGYPWQRETFSHWQKAGSWWRRLLHPRRQQRVARALREAPFPTLAASADPMLRRRLVLALGPQRHSLAEALVDLLARVEPAPDRAFLAHCLFDMYDYLPWLLLRHDRLGMAASMEMRVPFLENGVIDLAFHLPRPAKLQDKRGKCVVKAVAAEELPQAIVEARKRGFPAPTGFTTGCEALLRGGLAAARLEWSAGDVDAAIALAARDGRLRYHLVGLEIWLRLFFAGQSADSIGEALLAHAR